MAINTLPALPTPEAATSAGDIFAAVYELWKEAFPNGPFAAIYRDALPPTVSPSDIGHPYVIVKVSGNRRIKRTNFSEYWQSVVTFKVWDSTHELAEERIALIGDVFDDAEQDLDFYLQPEGESQSSQSVDGQSSQSASAANSQPHGTSTDDTPAAGKIMLCDRMDEPDFGEADRVVRHASISYRIERRKRRRNPAYLQ